MPLVIALVALDIVVSSFVAVRMTGYRRRSRPTAPPGRAPATQGTQTPNPALDASGPSQSGPGPGDMARVAGGTALIVLLIVAVAGCVLIGLMSNAMTGHLR